MAVVTKAVVAICVVFVPGEAVGANGVPVRVGLADKTTEVVPVDVVTPVPPLATFSVPESTTAPVVAVEGVKPVEPAENEDTPPPVPCITLPLESTASRYCCVPVGTLVICSFDVLSFSVEGLNVKEPDVSFNGVNIPAPANEIKPTGKSVLAELELCNI